MAFESIDRILSGFADRVRTPEQRQLQAVLTRWPEVVGKSAIAHTRPVSIHRNILYVATSSAAWTQDLTFRRTAIVRKLNRCLPDPLHDIKFSTARWPGQSPETAAVASPDGPHPSSVSSRLPADLNDSPRPKTAIAAFELWAETLRARSRNWPSCPRCHCPTPPGELERWSMCRICMARER